MFKYIAFLGFFFILTGCALHSAPEPHPRSTTAHLNIQLGMGYLQNGQTARAKQKLLTALAQAPELPETHMAMGYFLLKTGELQQAQAYYQTALKLAPERGDVQNSYGVFLYHIQGKCQYLFEK